MSIVKYGLIFSVFFILNGCAGTSANVRSLVNLDQIEPGMSKAEVQNKLGEDTIIGYEVINRTTGEVRPITVKNPYRSEVLNAADKTYDVSYFLTDVKQPDGVVTDDELTPFVFQNEKLVARGWFELEKIRKN